jgi:uncharacterized protein
MRAIAEIAAALVFGLIFGFGLIVSHMVDPARVAAFLDVAGNWNPALAFVMGGAVIVAAPAFAVARRTSRALLGPIELPDRFRIDARLIIGATLFGIGWGLSGICPGPALVLLGSLEAHALVFVGALIIGIWISHLWRGNARAES